MNPSAFKLDRLSAFYGTLRAVNNVSLEIAEKSRVGVFGHNGSGKSTLLKCLVGAVDDVEGDVSFKGSNIQAGAPHRNVLLGIGMVPQTNNVFASLQVEKCLSIAGMRRGRTDAREMYEWFPILGERRHQRAGSMSGGEQQMLAVAMALMTNPQAILLDEPTAGLSPVAAETVLEAIKSINEKTGSTIVLVEQNVLAALDIVERAIVMRSGEVVFDGASNELSKKEDLWQWF